MGFRTRVVLVGPSDISTKVLPPPSCTLVGSPDDSPDVVRGAVPEFPAPGSGVPSSTLAIPSDDSTVEVSPCCVRCVERLYFGFEILVFRVSGVGAGSKR